MTTIITNEDLYNSKVISVDVNNIKNVNEKSFCANVEIDLSEYGNMEIDGEFGYNDFEAEYGFIFLK